MSILIFFHLCPGTRQANYPKAKAIGCRFSWSPAIRLAVAAGFGHGISPHETKQTFGQDLAGSSQRRADGRALADAAGGVHPATFGWCIQLHAPVVPDAGQTFPNRP